MGLRKANESETITLSDGDWIKLKKKLSQRDRETLIREMPDVKEGESLTMEQGLSVVHMLFEMLVTEWSLGTVPTLEEYLELEDTSADEVNEAIINHFNKLMPVEPTEQESKKRRS